MVGFIGYGIAGTIGLATFTPTSQGVPLLLLVATLGTVDENRECWRRIGARASSVTRSRIVVRSFGTPACVLSATSRTVGILGNAGAALIYLIIAFTS